MKKNNYIYFSVMSLACSFLLALGSSILPEGWIGMMSWCAFASMGFGVLCIIFGVTYFEQE